MRDDERDDAGARAREPGTVTWRELLAEATDRLTRAAVGDSPALDARRIVERAAGADGAALLAELDRPVTVREITYYDRMVERRITGEPLQYVLGSWAFRTLDLFLDGRVLIPRPETEIVAGHALAVTNRLVDERPGAENVTVVDLGTGSGAIALSIAVECVRADVWATDVSEDALEVARANLAGIGRPARRVTMLHGDWYEALPDELRGRVDVIVSNPPYVAAHEPLPAEVRDWEPATALVPGPSGLEAYEHIVAVAPRWLRPGGALVLEIGETQAAAVEALARAAGFTDVAVHTDLTGRDRVVVVK